MPIDPEVARALGWPKLKYAWVEHERRWLAARVPVERVVRVELITDLYVTGAQLRLREAVPVDGGEPVRRLARKADLDAATRLMTSIYLTAHEHELLSCLPGRRLRKRRHYLAPVDGAAAMSVDLFEAPAHGLLLAEAEFADAAAMAAFPAPDFALREVTDDPRYTGGALAQLRPG